MVLAGQKAYPKTSSQMCQLLADMLWQLNKIKFHSHCQDHYFCIINNMILPYPLPGTLKEKYHDRRYLVLAQV